MSVDRFISRTVCSQHFNKGKNMESVTLYFKNGSSDKVYQAAIVPTGDLFNVTFAFGRRGTTLQTGTKTPTPVDIATAKNVFQKLVREKTSKGYTPGEAGTPFEHTENTRAYTGILPQLLNPIDEAEAERLIKDAPWFLQEKFDGRRLLIEKRDGRIRGINRRGLVVDIPLGIARTVQRIPRDCLFDGECVGDVYRTFDLLFDDDCSLTDLPYLSRVNALERILEKVDSENVKLVHSIYGEDRKRTFFAALRTMNAEGAVFKLASAPYRAGRPSSGGTALKFKFTTTGSFIVAKHNECRSVALKLFRAKESCGNATIPPNQPIPAVGAVVEVRYLYAFRGGSLFQPVFVGARDDIDPSECFADQLKFKREESDDDGE